MTLGEFEMHRPILGRQLVQILDDLRETKSGWDIMPRYEDDIRFVAEHPAVGRIICVGPDHPLSMVEEEAPGCQGTWWWEDDIQAEHPSAL